jgi:DNA-binding CsgD family transcriptional regulator
MARFTAELTPRERAVLFEAQDGATTAEIAARLFVAPSTVKTHLSSIYSKANAASRVGALARSLDPETVDLSGFGLSPRQQDVVRCLLLGKANDAIARSLCVSAETVKGHLKRIYDVLGARNRYEAVSIVLRAQRPAV